MYRDGQLRVSKNGNEVACGPCAIGGETKEMIFLPPPSLLELVIPDGPVRFEFFAGMLEEAWDKPRAGACVIVVEVPGQCRFEVALDPTRYPEHRRYVPVSLSIPGGRSPDGNDRLLRVATEGVPIRDFRWAVLGAPRILVGEDSTRQLLSDIEALATNRDNLQFNLYREMMYWANEYRGGSNRTIRERLDPVACERHCPSLLAGLLPRLKAEQSTLPTVMDFGSGPFSSLRYLEEAGLARVTPVDILGREWATFLEHFGIQYPVQVVPGSGESLTSDLGDKPFDVVYVQNALDHTQVPILSWLNLVRMARPGGYVGQLHAVREASWEKFDQLHQYDLFPDADGALWIEGADRKPLNLVDGLGLEVVEHGGRRVEDGPKEGKEFFWSLYRRVGDAQPTAAFLEKALGQFVTAFNKRDRWTRRVEDFLLRSVDRHVVPLEGSYGLPYWVGVPAAETARGKVGA